MAFGCYGGVGWVGLVVGELVRLEGCVCGECSGGVGRKEG